MLPSIAIVGAGIIGMTNAVCLLEQGFAVTVFTKDHPFKTNSDAAVATWYAPDDSKPILQQLCLESLAKFDMLGNDPCTGVQKISIINYFKSEKDFKQSHLAKESLKTHINAVCNLSENYVDNKDFPIAVSALVPLITPNIYRPFMLNRFTRLGGKLETQNIEQLSSLVDSYDIIINCAGWEAKYLTNDADVYPVRGQIEIIKVNDKLKSMHSINVKDINAYVVFRPQNSDCVIGTTYQIHDTEKEARTSDKDEIIKKVLPFFSEEDLLKKTITKVGIRCGRSDVRIESEYINDTNGRKKLLIHCYGHGGSGFSASWGSADKVFKECLSYTQNINLS